MRSGENVPSKLFESKLGVILRNSFFFLRNSTISSTAPEKIIDYKMGTQNRQLPFVSPVRLVGNSLEEKII